MTDPPHPPERRPQLTLILSNDGILTADYQKADEISQDILLALRQESVGYASLGTALTLARLANPDCRLSPSVEVRFVGDCMEWVDTYFVIPEQAVKH